MKIYIIINILFNTALILTKINKFYKFQVEKLNSD